MSTQLASRILSNRSYNWQSTGIWEDLVVEGAEWLATCYAEYGRVASEMRNELKVWTGKQQKLESERRAQVDRLDGKWRGGSRQARFDRICALASCVCMGSSEVWLCDTPNIGRVMGNKQ